IHYTPPPTVAKMLQSEAKVTGIMGPVGSGKSVGCIMFMFNKAARMPPGKDGIRRSRWAIVRNTQAQLRDTSWATFKEWFPVGVAGEWKEQAQTYIFRSGDIEATFIGRALDTPSDVGRLLSLDITGAWVNEAREIDQAVFEGLLGRCGRYNPDKLSQDERGWSGIVWDTNPPMEGSYWHEKIEDPPPHWKIFRQPGGLDPNAENVENLPPDYYQQLVENNSPEWAQVYVHCHYGLGNAGKPVWRDFKRGIHVAPQTLTLPDNIDEPLLVIGMDFGLTPACVIGYQTTTGQVQILHELWTDDMGIERFVQTKLKPLLRRYPEADALIVGDPAGRNRSMNDERSVFDILKTARLRAIEAPTNALAPRLGAVENFLTRMVDGKPGLIISPSCTHLIRAMDGGYRYATKRSGAINESPEKNIYSHVADALQYFALYFEAGAKRERRRKDFPVKTSPWRPGDIQMGY
ncbi:MAG: hypothetical protein ACP5D5_08855, partial [Acidithiobacillus sp.]|uniref:hypothetical protein n=1 Tax=Acidithiobacillus sp. TaxID=1872118 RepID=UPI003D025326